MTAEDKAYLEFNRIGQNPAMGSKVPKQESADFLEALIEQLQDSLNVLLEEIEDEKEAE